MTQHIVEALQKLCDYSGTTRVESHTTGWAEIEAPGTFGYTKVLISDHSQVYTFTVKEPVTFVERLIPYVNGRPLFGAICSIVAQTLDGGDASDSLSDSLET